MSATVGLIFVGWISVFLIQLFRPSTFWRLVVVGLTSLYFLVYSLASFWAVTVIFVWAALIFFLNFNAQKKVLIRAYIVGIVGIFIAFKFQLFSFIEKNILLEAAVPLGFSFMMFHSIALLSDRANDILKKPMGWLEYFSSVFFFPTFSAGPFHKIQVFQENVKKSLCGYQTFQGYCYFCLGAFKFALSGLMIQRNYLGSMPLARANPDIHSINILLISSVYLYANFSGFSDIVIGFGKMMGFNIPLNFTFPFFSKSMAEYWRKWHITLGAWFREYVFLPLNYILARKWQSLGSETTAKISVFVTFLLIGIWHQFSFKILVYSILNASLVAFVFPKNKNGWWGYPLTFIFALLINMLFISQNMDVFFKVLSNIFVVPPERLIYKNLMVTAVAVSSFIAFYFLEKLVAKITQPEKSALIIGLNFVVSIFALIMGITWGIGHVNAVYVGY